ncbi:MAG: alanine--glyoxylate aminotransferase family protein [Alphaproteobacteria bacterium]|nr:alanine--glyoxylate aminotransferase family protein [Alphaproteobacteria bacterium]
MNASFDPPHRILMGPGPSDVHPRVLAAMARSTIGHLDPAFVAIMDSVKAMLRYAFRTSNDVTFAISGPGSTGMEACFVNLLEPGEKAIVCVNGAFGGRMKENVERCGAVPVIVNDEWGRAVDPTKVATAIKANPDAKALAFVHAETSTGVRSEAAELCRMAQNAGMLTIVDVVTSLGGISVEVDGWGVDAAYGGSQKCLSCPPGLSPVTFGPRALARVKARKTKVQSWFLDLNLVTAYWGGEGNRTYHHTAPVNALFALHEALAMLREEGLDTAIARHAACHAELVEALAAIGLRLPIDSNIRLPQLNLVSIPDGVADAPIRKAMLDQFGLEIGGGLGSFAGKVWRIGLMGQSASRRHVALCAAALRAVLP